jgi:hypothetical protein
MFHDEERDLGIRRGKP